MKNIQTPLFSCSLVQAFFHCRRPRQPPPPDASQSGVVAAAELEFIREFLVEQQHAGPLGYTLCTLEAALCWILDRFAGQEIQVCQEIQRLGETSGGSSTHRGGGHFTTEKTHPLRDASEDRRPYGVPWALKRHSFSLPSPNRQKRISPTVSPLSNHQSTKKGTAAAAESKTPPKTPPPPSTTPTEHLLRRRHWTKVPFLAFYENFCLEKE